MKIFRDCKNVSWPSLGLFARFETRKNSTHYKIRQDRTYHNIVLRDFKLPRFHLYEECPFARFWSLYNIVDVLKSHSQQVQRRCTKRSSVTCANLPKNEGVFEMDLAWFGKRMTC